MRYTVFIMFFPLVSTSIASSCTMGSYIIFSFLIVMPFLVDIATLSNIKVFESSCYISQERSSLDLFIAFECKSSAFV